MSISLSIFDVFANGVPGAVYLAVGVYLAVRWGWVDVADIAGLDTTFALLGAILVAYLLGQVLGPGMRRIAEPRGIAGGALDQARDEFRRRNPTVAERAFVEADPFTLLAGLRQASPESAIEVDRSRAAGIMLSSTGPALLVGAAIGVAEFGVDQELAALASGAALLALGLLALREGRRRRRWALVHTYECAVWLPDVDERLGT